MSIIWWILKRSKTELKIVLATLAVLIILPVVSVVVLASSGSAVVGQALANLNPITHLVEIFNPNGQKVADLQLSTVWPARGYISDEFGTFEKFRQEAGSGPHTGIDIANRWNISGDPVTPFAKGTVSRVHNTDDNSCGKYVLVSHGFNVTSAYCHLDNAVAIEHDEVVPGDVIGYMGKTGFATGVHVHFGVYVYGIAVNPRTFMVGVPEASIRGSL